MGSARTFGCAAVLAVAMVSVACTKPAFTEGVRARFALSPSDIGRIQFYTSREILLQREIDDQSKVVSGTGLSIRGGVRVEEVDIPEHTPGVAVRVEGDYILVSFSRQHPDHALWFGLKKNDDHALPDARNYELVQLDNAPGASGPFKPDFSKGFLVTYAGQKYRLVDGQMWSAHLLYELDESFAKEKVKLEPPGWHLAEGSPSVVSTPVAAATPVAPTASAVAAAPDAGTTK